jgi:hypothetical protein
MPSLVEPKIGHLYTFGHELLRVVEGPIDYPLSVLRPDYDEHFGPDDPPPSAYEIARRRQVRVEYIPPREAQAPEGGRWLDESCFPALEPVSEDASMPRWPEDHVKRPEPDHSRADLRVGRVWLAEEAEKYTPAQAILDRLTEAEADLGRIAVGTLSKHKTHRWTGRHWKEIDDG